MRIFLLSIILLFGLTATAQTKRVYAKQVWAKEEIKLAGKTVTGISDDGNFTNASIDSLVTQLAIKQFILSLVEITYEYYDNDVAAGLGGVAIGEYYRATEANTMGKKKGDKVYREY